MNNSNVYTVKRQTEISSKQWGVYLNGKLVERGFFSRAAAEECADECAYDACSGQSRHLSDGERFNTP